jgi:hypothetical protein
MCVDLFGDVLAIFRSTLALLDRGMGIPQGTNAQCERKNRTSAAWSIWG